MDIKAAADALSHESATIDATSVLYQTVITDDASKFKGNERQRNFRLRIL
jgi:hypothetical protein